MCLSPLSRPWFMFVQAGWYKWTIHPIRAQGHRWILYTNISERQNVHTEFANLFITRFLVCKKKLFYALLFLLHGMPPWPVRFIESNKFHVQGKFKFSIMVSFLWGNNPQRIHAQSHVFMVLNMPEPHGRYWTSKSMGCENWNHSRVTCSGSQHTHHSNCEMSS